MTPLDPFTCQETFARLDAFLDRSLSAEEMAAVREHLAVCVVCAREYRFEEGVLDALRAKLAHVDLAPTVVDHVRAAVERAAREMHDGR